MFVIVLPISIILGCFTESTFKKPTKEVVEESIQDKVLKEGLRDLEIVYYQQYVLPRK